MAGPICFFLVGHFISLANVDIKIKFRVFGSFNIFFNYNFGTLQGRMPQLSRTVSMEQRWTDLANLLSFPPTMGVGMGVGDMASTHAHYSSHYPYQVSFIFILLYK